jgi:hypothetical protein
MLFLYEWRVTKMQACALHLTAYYTNGLVSAV